MNKLLPPNKYYSRCKLEKGEKLLLPLGTHDVMSFLAQSPEGSPSQHAAQSHDPQVKRGLLPCLGQPGVPTWHAGNSHAHDENRI